MSLRLICRVGHYARHGDQHGRSKTTDLGADQGISGRDIGGCIPGSQGRAQPVYRAGSQAVRLRPARAGRQRRAAALYRAHDRPVAPASNPPGAAIPQGREAVEKAMRAQAGFRMPLYGGGRGLAGRDGRAAQHAVRARHQEAHGARAPGVRRPALRAPGGHLGFPSVQPPPSRGQALRGSKPYQNKRRHWTKTNPAGAPIGTRRAPQPDGVPGYIRIDSVHQGDLDGVKGVYHINAVDCVTQMQFVATCEKISEAYMLPVIRQLLDGFPFVILGFHSDNGSEYINYQVAKLLDKLLSSSPNRGSATPTTTPWRNPRTAPWYASILATRISRSTAPAWSMSSVRATSTLTPISTARVSSLKRSRTPREKSARNTATRT